MTKEEKKKRERAAFLVALRDPETRAQLMEILRETDTGNNQENAESAETKVEQALLKRALGYTYTEVKKEGTANGKSAGAVKITTIEKTVPPETAALIFWLKNRKPEAWREKVDTYIAADTQTEDALTKSLREMAETLVSDTIPGAGAE